MTRRPLHEMTIEMVDAAMGRTRADLILTGGRVVNVWTREVMSGRDVAVKAGRIARVGHCRDLQGPDTRVVDVGGRLLAPGLLDGHVHIESSMLTVTGFAEAVLPRGTTCAFADPHEMANVMGARGVQHMIDEGRSSPLAIYFQVPSCVPACPGFETAGAALGPEEIEDMLGWDGVIGLAEMMNFPGVIGADRDVHAAIAAALRRRQAVGGHYGLPDLTVPLGAYAAAGIGDCHESTTADDAAERLRNGMYAMLRFGSAWHDIPQTIQAVTVMGLDPRHVILVTDDRHAGTILERGHVDDVVRQAVAHGVDPLVAWQMATINTATRFGVQWDVGSIAPGRWADILVLEDLGRAEPAMVFAAGRLVAQDGRMVEQLPRYTYPEDFMTSVRLSPVTAEDFHIPAGGESEVTARVIRVIENSVLTRAEELPVPVRGGRVEACPDRDILKAAVLDRHRRTGNRGLGLVSGLGLTGGAVASTVAHDSHNLLVVGASDADMAAAANALIEAGGGMCAVRDGKVLAIVALPVAGILSPESPLRVARGTAGLKRAWADLGSRLESGMMTMSLIPLAVLPELRLTDRGLVDTLGFEMVPLLAT